MKKGHVSSCSRFIGLMMALFVGMLPVGAALFPKVSGQAAPGCFPLAAAGAVATICTDAADFKVVGIAANLLADDVQRVTGRRPQVSLKLPRRAAVVAGTLGKSKLIDRLVAACRVDVSPIKGKWESFIVLTTEHPSYHTPLLLVIGSDRRGTAFGLTSLSEAIGVSPWYWWADVVPQH